MDYFNFIQKHQKKYNLLIIFQIIILIFLLHLLCFFQIKINEQCNSNNSKKRSGCKNRRLHSLL